MRPEERRRQAEQARLSGGAARRAGRSIDTCPAYGMGGDWDWLREEWRAGWRSEDDQRKAARGR